MYSEQLARAAERNLLMNCPKCNASLPDDAVVCSECGEEFALEAQKGRVLLARQRTKGIITEIIRSKAFLAYAVVLSLFCLFCLLSCISITASGVSLNLLSILVTVFVGIAVYYCWSMYAGIADTTSANIAKMSWMYKTLRIICQVLYILLIVLLVLLFFPMIVFMGAVKSPEFSEKLMPILNAFLSEGDIDEILYNKIANFDYEFWVPIICAVAAVTIGIMIALGILCHKALKKAEKHLGEIANATGTNQYSVYTTPSKFMVVIGCVIMGYWAIETGLSIAMGIIFESLSIYGIITSLSTPLLGLCLIMLSFVFDKIHDFQIENLRAIQKEQDILAVIARRTTQAKTDAEDSKRASESQE